MLLFDRHEVLTNIGPWAPNRGGAKEGADIYVALLKEMRASFRTQFSISIATPSS